MDRAFVGMGATVLDGAVIEEGGVIAAGSVLPPGKRIGAMELWMGNPAKLVRVLTEAARNDKGELRAVRLLVIDKPGWLVVHPSKNGPWSMRRDANARWHRRPAPGG